jgi:hypothetical protein
MRGGGQREGGEGKEGGGKRATPAHSPSSSSLPSCTPSPSREGGFPPCKRAFEGGGKSCEKLVYVKRHQAPPTLINIDIDQYKFQPPPHLIRLISISIEKI